MTTRSELAAVRARNLDRVRAANGMEERFTLQCACALHDRTFTAAFARLSPTRRFTCERVETGDHAPGTPDGGTGPAVPDPWRIAAAEVDFASLACPWCAAGHVWIRCGRCKLLVCSAQTEGKIFQCRKSCGAHSRTTSMAKLEATRVDGGAFQRTLGHLGRLLLPGSRR